jgi:hypothetical protein
VAVACDEPPTESGPADPVWLDLNDAEAIARFILETR